MVEVTDGMIDAAVSALGITIYGKDTKTKMRTAIKAALDTAPQQDLAQLVEALEAAKEVVDVAAEMTSCRSDDDFVWAAQFKIDAALATARIRQGIQEAKANG